MAAETGNANIFGTVTNGVQIPTANLCFFDHGQLDQNACEKFPESTRK